MKVMDGIRDGMFKQTVSLGFSQFSSQCDEVSNVLEEEVLFFSEEPVDQTERS